MTSPISTSKSKLDNLPFMKAYLSNNQVKEEVSSSATMVEQNLPVLERSISQSSKMTSESSELSIHGNVQPIKSEPMDFPKSASFSSGIGLKRKFHEMSPEEAMGDSGKLLPNGKKTKGRVKIEMKFIGNKLRRYTTFSKRKTGIMKKAFELSTLTGTQVLLLVASETGHVYTFATNKLRPMVTEEAGKQLIQQCLNTSGSVESGPSMVVGGTDCVETPTSFEAVASLNANQLTFVPTESSARLFNMPSSTGGSGRKSSQITDNEDDGDDLEDDSKSNAPDLTQNLNPLQQQFIQQLLPTILSNPQALSAAMQMMPGLQQLHSQTNQTSQTNNQNDQSPGNQNALLYALPLAMAMQQQMQQQPRVDGRKS